MNSVEILGPVANSVEVSSFDIHTTTYFLQAYMTVEEHQPARKAIEPGEENGNKEPEEGEPEDGL